MFVYITKRENQGAKPTSQMLLSISVAENRNKEILCPLLVVFMWYGRRVYKHPILLVPQGAPFRVPKVYGDYTVYKETKS